MATKEKTLEELVKEKDDLEDERRKQEQEDEVKPEIEGEPVRSNIREILGVDDDAEEVDWLKILIYAEAGVGKTYLLGTIEDVPDEFLPAILLDVERGKMTIRNRKKIDKVKVRSMAKMDQVHNELRKAGLPFYYRTIMVDNCTELEKIEMREIMELAWSKNPATVDKNVPSPREYGISNTKMSKYLRAYKDLECHLICTAWSREIKDKEGKVVGWEPDLGSAQIRKHGPGYFDIVGYMTASKPQGQPVERSIQFVKTDKVAAKDRSQALPERMVDPTIPKIWELIEASNKALANTT